jgi:hypothetical protein
MSLKMSNTSLKLEFFWSVDYPRIAGT